MAGHPSVKKRQKELQRKERQAEKLARRDERRTRPNTPAEIDYSEFQVPAGGADGASGESPGAPAAPEPPAEARPTGEGQQGT